MTIASDLLQRHIQTLVDDNTQWQTLIADDVLWELAYAPSIGHPAQLSGREEAVRHAIWFVGAVENFRFFELKVYALADPERTSSHHHRLELLTYCREHFSPSAEYLAPNAFACWINSSTIRYRKAACRGVDMSPTDDSAARVTAMARTPWHSTE